MPKNKSPKKLAMQKARRIVMDAVEKASPQMLCKIAECTGSQLPKLVKEIAKND